MKPPELARRSVALLVTDDPELAAGYRLKLELDGYDVDVAAPGAELPEAEFDLVFFDLADACPARLEALRALRELAPLRGLPTLLISDQGRAVVEKAGLDLGPFEGVLARTGIRL